MNSMPPQTAAPAAEPSGQQRGRVADYDRLVDDLAYTYEGIFSRDMFAPPARSPPTRSIRRLCRSSPSVA
jgi:hypothetical protein